ncbi:uncharacterized protein LOC128265561 [Drosophila gunungcola]|uniref:Uncharacterized protein n=1 Tax=Drosophila gunungcola TaxID=103775 RepID=A0A9P9YAL6_9MUSC|nr:uncharacterized protein LOC128265561 [Drosophila gunungcola]KAI8033459.1 hypothetical protein M5D96_013782 [Drosophila gunungcola]
MTEETDYVERRFCGISINHKLRSPHTKITNPYLFKFAKKINPGILEDSPICLSCYKNLVNLYNTKNNNAKKHQERRIAESVTDASGSQSSQGTTTFFARLQTTNNNNKSSADGSLNAIRSAPLPTENRNSSVRNAAVPQSTSQYINDDDDPNSNLSMNAINGTRLPHIQPIPRRRPTTILNKESMDIYLQGTTGG